MTDITKISKYMAYLLRHHPEGMDISDQGFVRVSNLLDKLRERWPYLTQNKLVEVVEQDPKGRYEIRGDKIRARYGHSIKVNPKLYNALVEVLYHGTSPQASEKILKEGIKPKGRQKVHLSKTPEDAREVGSRHCQDPVILEIDVSGVKSTGVRIEKASEQVYVADYIPSEFITIRKRK